MSDATQTHESVLDGGMKFSDLQLSEPLMNSLSRLGYEEPTPIQAACIPAVLNGSDILGQAQTGTGKTAAFALPLLANISSKVKKPQVLVLTPTRELAIQVAEAFQNYGSEMKGLKILPVYGGQPYDVQLRHLKKGVQVVVGTPGRIMDHIRRETLDLSELSTLVLDEADEMLRMGFIDDVEWILDHTPETHQTALFSATMPERIEKITRKYLNNPVHVHIKEKSTTAKTINQSYIVTKREQKLDALTRVLEVQETDGIIIFVRTKNLTTQVAMKLKARGYNADALNGDMGQVARERMVEQLKKGNIDILTATDIAARGLDVERISHVINYDIPYDAESYVHRIGRTGRAGRTGSAITFISPREGHLLKAIERENKVKMEKMSIPTVEDVNQQRISGFQKKVSEAMEDDDLDAWEDLILNFIEENEPEPVRLAAALAKLAQGGEGFLMEDQELEKISFYDREGRGGGRGRGEGRGDGRGPRRGRDRGGRGDRGRRGDRDGRGRGESRRDRGERSGGDRAKSRSYENEASPRKISKSDEGSRAENRAARRARKFGNPPASPSERKKGKRRKKPGNGPSYND